MGHPRIGAPEMRTPEEMQERLHALHDEIDCLKYEVEKAAADERAKIMAWLEWNDYGHFGMLAKSIKAGEHLK